MSATSNLSFPIEKFFPKESYKARCNQDKKVIPIYLTALNQDMETIKKSLKKENCEYHDKKYGLTVLTVAVMVQRFDVVKHLLLDWKVSPSPKDNAGLTPLHYACLLQDAKSMILLQNANKAQKVTIDRFEIFPGWKKALKPPFPKEDEIVGYMESEEGKTLPMTAKEFSEITHAQFYDGVVIPNEKALVTFFANSLCSGSLDEVKETVNEWLYEKLNKFVSPKLMLAKQGKAGLGVRALQIIKTGELCGIYGGEMKPDFNTYTIGTLEDNLIISGNKIRNFIPMCNDGFPNACSEKIRLPCGRQYFALMAIKDIAPGEDILWDYGAHHQIKQFAREEIGLKEIELFFKEISLYKVASRIADLESLKLRDFDDPRFQELVLKRTRLSYLFHTPSLMNYLFIKEIVHLDDVYFFRTRGVFKKMDESGFLHSTYETLFNIYEKIEKLIKTCKSEETIVSFRRKFSELALSHSYHGLIVAEVYFNQVTELKQFLELEKEIEAVMKLTDLISLSEWGNEIDLKTFAKIKQEFYQLDEKIVTAILEVRFKYIKKRKFSEILLELETKEKTS